MTDQQPSATNTSRSLVFNRQASAWHNLRVLGETILYGIDRVGEFVADSIGLNDSKYQYVIDGMTEADWRRAQEIQRRREEEEAQQEASRQARALESGDIHIVVEVEQVREDRQVVDSTILSSTTSANNTDPSTRSVSTDSTSTTTTITTTENLFNPKVINESQGHLEQNVS